MNNPNELPPQLPSFDKELPPQELNHRIPQKPTHPAPKENTLPLPQGAYDQPGRSFSFDPRLAEEAARRMVTDPFDIDRRAQLTAAFGSMVVETSNEVMSRIPPLIPPTGRLDLGGTAWRDYDPEAAATSGRTDLGGTEWNQYRPGESVEEAPGTDASDSEHRPPAQY